MKLGFEELYSEIEKNNANKFDDAIKRANEESKRNKIISLILCIIIDIILFKLLNNSDVNQVSITNNFFSSLTMIFPLVIVDVMIFAIIHVIFSKNKREYTRLFKENIISVFIANFYDDLFYNPKSRIAQSIYDAARYNEYYNRYESEDYFRAKILNKYNMEMAEVKTEKVETHRGSDGKTRTETHLKFHGLFARVEMEKSLQTSLQIRGNHEVAFGKRVNMDSGEFEKYFDVASDNKIITMQVLTHDVMEMLINFKQQLNIKFDISIYGNQMYLRFHTGEMFELSSIKKGAFDKVALKKYYDILEFTYILSKKLIELIEEAKI